VRVGVPHGHWKSTTFVAGLTTRGMIAPFVLDGPINRDASEAHVEKVLVPEPRPGAIVVMDNLSSHKGPRARNLIEAAGQHCSTCRPTGPTSTRSRTPSPSSRRSCAKRPSEPSTASGTPSVASSISSRRMSAETTSPPPGTMQLDRLQL
jgi:transposase